MRISSEQLRQNALLRLQGQIESHQDLQTRITSGRRYLRGSENIVAFDRTMEISARANSLDQLHHSGLTQGRNRARD
ncbi:MAG: flagellin-like hook-associated protein FlgL [Candidatus Poriferisodalaceae bacterium]|jgi:flagellin-like hook-associated protein FlgL